MAMRQHLKRRILPWGLAVIPASASFVLGLPNMALAQSTQINRSPETATLSASEAFRAAYTNRYTMISSPCEGKTFGGLI